MVLAVAQGRGKEEQTEKAPDALAGWGMGFEAGGL